MLARGFYVKNNLNPEADDLRHKKLKFLDDNSDPAVPSSH